MEQIEIFALLTGSIGIIGCLILLGLGILGKFLFELYRLVMENKTKIDTLRGAHEVNHGKKK